MKTIRQTKKSELYEKEENKPLSFKPQRKEAKRLFVV